MHKILAYYQSITKPMLYGIGIGAFIAILAVAIFWLYYLRQNPQVKQQVQEECLAQALAASRDYYQEFCEEQGHDCSAQKLSDQEVAGFLDFYEQARQACMD